MDPEALAATVSDYEALMDSLRYDDEAVNLNNFELSCLINALAFTAVERPMHPSLRIEARTMRKLLRATAILNALAWERLDEGQ
jgi:hypothetical protein